MYAILKTGGKQYKVSEGDVIYVEKLGVEDGATVSFDEVLVVGEGDSITVGAPYVSGAVVTGTVEKTGKGKKINFPLLPKDVSYGSNKKVWWRGECGHEWQASPHSRTGKNSPGCPYCSGNRVLAGFNDLASRFPEINCRMWI